MLTYKQRQEIINDLTKKRFELLKNKGKEYSEGEKDINYNFTEIAKRLGTRLAETPEYVCLVYLFKHIMSLEYWAKNGKMSSGEDIFSRIADIENYLDILQSILIDKKNKKS